MSTATPTGRSPGSPPLAGDRPTRLAGSAGPGARAIEAVRSGVALLMRRVPATMRETRARAHGTTTALQTLPDPTLRWLAATSVGLGAGLHLAGAPRLVTAAGLAPAAIMGAAIVLRPPEPVVHAEEPDPTAARPGSTRR